MQQKLPKARSEKHKLEGNGYAINIRQWVISPDTDIKCFSVGERDEYASRKIGKM